MRLPGRHGGARHVALAACVEFIHTATLLHDDVVDESALRRGLASANAVFGNKASVLVGDFLFARAFQLMVEDGSLKVLAILSRAAATIAEGEVLQLATQNDLSTTEDRYLEVIQGKTAALFAAACQVGAVVADRPDGRGGGAGRLRHATSASPSSWSTTRWTTPPTRRRWARPSATISARARSPCRCWPPIRPATPPSRRSGGAPSSTASSSRADLDHAMALMARHGAIATTLARAARFAGAAKAALAVFPDSPIRRALLDVADYTVSRAR